MYSLEHVAKVYIFVFVHNSFHNFFPIISFIVDLNQVNLLYLLRFCI